MQCPAKQDDAHRYTCCTVSKLQLLLSANNEQYAPSLVKCREFVKIGRLALETTLVRTGFNLICCALVTSRPAEPATATGDEALPDPSLLGDAKGMLE